MCARKDWPENLEGEAKGVRTYYRYRDPITGKSTGLGTDYRKAAEAVRIVNARRTLAQASDLADRIEGKTRTLRDHATKFLNEVLRKRRFRKTGASLSQKTLDGYELQLTTFCNDIGEAVDVAAVTRRQVAEFLDGKPAVMSNRYRSLLVQLFQYAVAQGLIEANIVEATMKRTEVVERRRLTVKDFEKIYEKAEPWFQATMNLARRSLQRREDLVLLKFDAFVDGVLSLQQQKTASRGTGALRIHAGPRLTAAIAQCRDALASPYMVHTRHTWHNAKRAAWRTHWTQCAPDDLTREFSEIRDKLGLYANLPANQRPSFHEIRAMGAHEMELEGVDKAIIQALLGHSTAEMTEVYLDRHGVRWTEVRSA